MHALPKEKFSSALPGRTFQSQSVDCLNLLQRESVARFDRHQRCSEIFFSHKTVSNLRKTPGEGDENIKQEEFGRMDEFVVLKSGESSGS